MDCILFSIFSIDDGHAAVEDDEEDADDGEDDEDDQSSLAKCYQQIDIFFIA